MTKFHQASVDKNTSAGSPERTGKRKDMRLSHKNCLQRSEGLPHERGSRLLKGVLQREHSQLWESLEFKGIHKMLHMRKQASGRTRWH